MSVLSRVKKKDDPQGKPYVLVVGRSSSGKTTLAGTLPGRTLLLQAQGREYGSESAEAKAAECGHVVDSLSVASVGEWLEIAKELKGDKLYDQVYLDGWSALTYQCMELPEVGPVIANKARGNNVFGAFDKIKQVVADVQRAYTELTSTAMKHPKGIFVTLAVDVVTEEDGTKRIKPAILGSASYTEFTRPSPSMITLAQVMQGDKLERVILTANSGPFINRVNGLLDSQNPGMLFNPNLGELLKLAATASKEKK